MVRSLHGAALLRRIGADRLVLRRFGRTAQHPAHTLRKPLFRRGEYRPQRTHTQREAIQIRCRAIALGAGRRRRGGHRRRLCRGGDLRADDQSGLFEPDALRDKLPPESAFGAPQTRKGGRRQGVLVLGLPVFVPAAQLLQPQPRQAADLSGLTRIDIPSGNVIPTGEVIESPCTSSQNPLSPAYFTECLQLS